MPPDTSIEYLIVAAQSLQALESSNIEGLASIGILEFCDPDKPAAALDVQRVIGRKSAQTLPLLEDWKIAVLAA